MVAAVPAVVTTESIASQTDLNFDHEAQQDSGAIRSARDVFCPGEAVDKENFHGIGGEIEVAVAIDKVSEDNIALGNSLGHPVNQPLGKAVPCTNAWGASHLDEHWNRGGASGDKGSNQKMPKEAQGGEEEDFFQLAQLQATRDAQLNK